MFVIVRERLKEREILGEYRALMMRRVIKRDRIGEFYKERLKNVSHTQILLKTLPYLWPKHHYYLRLKFLLSVLFMLLTITAELYVPIPMRTIIVTLTASAPSNSTINLTSSTYQGTQLLIYPVIMYGALRIGQALFPILRDTCFSSIAAYTERTIALQTFHHLQALSLSFHLKRETGAVLRSVSRGAAAYSLLVKSVIFSFAPILIRLVGTCTIFAVLYRWYFITLTAATIVIYTVYTLLTTQWRDKYRKIMNEKDNQYNSKVTGKLN